MNPSFDFATPDHFTAGAVGPPGARVFYLQAGEGGQTVTLKCEKEQVGALAEYLAGLLVRLAAGSITAPKAVDLREPLEPAWEVGAIGVGYDEARNRIIVEAQEATETDEEEAEEATAAAPEAEEAAAPAAPGDGETEAEPDVATARFSITREQATSFIEHARALMKSGRPTCPMCGGPRDAAGHVCPRSNGHVVHG